MKKLDVLIIDDEEGAVTTLQGMLTEFCPEIHILGHAGSITQALALTEELQPELVFLDIEMPPVGSGFDYLRLVKNRNFEVVFTTAYPQYAIKAINTVQPLAYLIKPYSVTDLLDAVQTALKKKDLAKSTKSAPTSQEQGLTVPSGKKSTVVLHFKDIMYCKADKMITEIFTQRNESTSKIYAYMSIGELEKELPTAIFFRIHNSFIVNYAYISRLEMSGRGGVIQLLNGTEIPIATASAKTFKEAFDSFLKGA